MRLPVALAGVTLVVACGSPAPAPGTTAPTPTTTTTTADPRPPADPVAWANAYCGGFALLLRSAAALNVQHPSPEAFRVAATDFESTSVTSLRATAAELEKLGPLGPDVANLHDRLVKAMRRAADKHAAVGTRLAATPADAKIGERYQQIKAGEFTEGADDEVDSLATDIGEKHPAAFDDNKICAEVRAATK